MATGASDARTGFGQPVTKHIDVRHHFRDFIKHHVANEDVTVTLEYLPTEDQPAILSGTLTLSLIKLAHMH